MGAVMELQKSDVLEIKRDFAATYLKKTPRVHSVGIGRTKDRYCLVVSGTEKGLAGVPQRYRGVQVMKRIAQPARVALAGDF